MKNNKILKLVAVIALIAAMAFAFVTFSEKPVEGSKAIKIEVVDNNQQSKTYSVKTDAEYLRQAMDEAEGLTYEGSEGPYGYSISAVNGIVADWNVDQTYWAFYVNDEYCNYGVDSQPVNDLDAFKIVYKK